MRKVLFVLSLLIVMLASQPEMTIRPASAGVFGGLTTSVGLGFDLSSLPKAFFGGSKTTTRVLGIDLVVTTIQKESSTNPDGGTPSGDRRVPIGGWCVPPATLAMAKAIVRDEEGNEVLIDPRIQVMGQTPFGSRCYWDGSRQALVMDTTRIAPGVYPIDLIPLVEGRVDHRFILVNWVTHFSTPQPAGLVLHFLDPTGWVEGELERLGLCWDTMSKWDKESLVNEWLREETPGFQLYHGRLADYFSSATCGRGQSGSTTRVLPEAATTSAGIRFYVANCAEGDRVSICKVGAKTARYAWTCRISRVVSVKTDSGEVTAELETLDLPPGTYEVHISYGKTHRKKVFTVDETTNWLCFAARSQ